VQEDVSYSEATKTGVEFTCVDEITDEEAKSIVSDHKYTVLWIVLSIMILWHFAPCCLPRDLVFVFQPISA
jgi:hypothetical protein